MTLPDSALDSPAFVAAKLSQIERDLEHRQNDYEQASGDVHRLVREYDLRMAQTKLVTQGDTETAKKDKALVAIAAAEDGLHARLMDAEGRYEALKAAIGVLDKRASILQSLARTQREVG